MKPDELTIYLAQTKQPWTVPYGENKWCVTNDEGRVYGMTLAGREVLTKERAVGGRLWQDGRLWR